MHHLTPMDGAASPRGAARRLRAARGNALSFVAAALRRVPSSSIFGATAIAVCALLVFGVGVTPAQGPRPFERDLLATEALFVELRTGAAAAPAATRDAATASSTGATSDPATPPAPTAHGIASLRVRGSGAAQRFYTLLAGRDAAVIAFAPDGKRLAQIPDPQFSVALPAAPARMQSTAPTATPAGAGGAASAPASSATQPPPSSPGASALAAMPAATAKDAKLVFATDFDVDADGRVIIADRGGNAVKIYDSTGALLSVIPVQAPVSVAALPGGEIAVTNLRSEKLVTVYSLRSSPVGGASQWRVAREFGEPADVTGDETARELNRYVNIGRLASDAEGNLYYTFFYLPEPTVRKYDRWGFLITEFELVTPEFQPSAQSARRAIERLRQQRISFGVSNLPILRQSVTALGVDPQSQDLWVALGTQLLHFDKEGSRRGTYRTFAPDSQRVEATAILVESDRLVISSDTLGAFGFPRPDKQPLTRPRTLPNPPAAN